MSRQLVTSKEETVQLKRTRIPLHEARDKIKCQGLDYDNFHYIFIIYNDEDNVARYMAAGYEFVQKDGSLVGEQAVDSATGTDSLVTIGGGKGDTLVLVCLPIDLYLEDQASEERDIKAREQGMIRDV